VFEGERAIGFRIFDIRADELYDLVGLCDGDIVLSVAGDRLSSPEAAFDVYERAKDLSLIAVQLRRGTSTATLSYTIVLE
jgi:type II secretory pathway component PulC